MCPYCRRSAIALWYVSFSSCDVESKLPILASVFKDVAFKYVWHECTASPEENYSLVCGRITLMYAIGVRRVLLSLFL